MVVAAMLSTNRQALDGNNNYQAGRDINTINNYPNEQHPLQKMIMAIKHKVVEDATFAGFIDDLAHYSMTEIDTIGLEEKLKQADRLDLLENALILKDLFARKLFRSQLSLVMQHAYVHILAYVCTAFNNKVKPAIMAGASIEEIDRLIYKEIIETVYANLADFSIEITTEHIKGMLFFLTGKCHLKWSQS